MGEGGLGAMADGAEDMGLARAVVVLVDGIAQRLAVYGEDLVVGAVGFVPALQGARNAPDWRYQVSTLGRFLCVRGGGGATARNAEVIHFRVSAGSMTSSNSNSDAVLSALPRSYMPATIFS